jgi:hypothetical protein
METAASRISGQQFLHLGWVQEQLLLALLDAYQAIEARNDPEELAQLAAHGIPHTPRTFVHVPDPANRDAVLSRAAQAQHLLARFSPAETLTLGMLLVRESIAHGAGNGTHRATLSPREVATLVKVRPALIQQEIERGALHASKLGHVSRITPQDLQAWFELKRPDRHLPDPD